MKLLKSSAATLVILSILFIVIRVLLVREGILYGTVAVARFDGLVAALSAISILTALATVFSIRKKRSEQNRRKKRKSHHEDFAGKLSDQFSTFATIGAVVTLIISSSNTIFLLYPVDPVGLTKPTCAGGHTYNTQYIAITAGADGVNSRSGPGRTFTPNGRFPKDCSIGFSGFCIGDSLMDPSASFDTQTWVSSRWLLVAKQQSEFKAWLANLLSGESTSRQFVTDVFLTPANGIVDVPLLAKEQCGSSYNYPSKIRKIEFDISSQLLTATSKHAANIGFSTWTPPGYGFEEDDRYQQIYDPHGKPEDNPGAARFGQKSVAWKYHDTLLSDLNPGRPGGPNAAATVLVMAIPCIAANVPADLNTATVSAFEIASQPYPLFTATPRIPYDSARLARTACQSNS